MAEKGRKKKHTAEEVLHLLELDREADIYPEESSSDDEDFLTQLNHDYGSDESESDYIPLERYVISVLL